jgi:hypothetical protein
VTSPGTQQPASGGTSAEARTGGGPKGGNGTDVAAPVPSANQIGNAGKPTIDANANTTAAPGASTTVAMAAVVPIAGNNAADPNAGNGTATKTGGKHGDKAADAGSSDAAQVAALPGGDPSTNQSTPAPPQPVAVVLSVPVIAAAPSAGGIGEETIQLAALSDAAKAGAPGGKTDRAGTAVAAPGDAGTPGAPNRDGATAGAKTTDAVGSGPAPQPSPKDLMAFDGLPNPGDLQQSSNADAVAAAGTGAGHIGEHGAARAPSDAIAAPPAETNRAPGQPAGPIADIPQQPIATHVRSVEAAVASGADGGDLPPGQAPAAGSQPPPDGSGSPITPEILRASAAPAMSSAPAGQAAAAPAAPIVVPIAGLAVEIAARAHAGKNRFDIRLDPPELGRIDVRLDVDHEGKVTSHLVVERAETLALLRRDAPELERSLQQAGLKTADDALQFTLRDQGFGHHNPNPHNVAPTGALRGIVPDPELPPVDAVKSGYGRLAGTGSGIDIRV